MHHLDPEKKFDVLLREIELLQNVFDKYDNILNRFRITMISFMAGAFYISAQENEYLLLMFSLIIGLVFWYLEAVWRRNHFAQYIHRSQIIRAALNHPIKTSRPMHKHEEEASFDTIPIMDLSNQMGPQPDQKSIIEEMTEKEISIFYILVMFIPAIIGFAAHLSIH